jgi:hypothetical protein
MVSVVLIIFGSPVLPAAIPCRRSRYQDDERDRPLSTEVPKKIVHSLGKAAAAMNIILFQWLI